MTRDPNVDRALGELWLISDIVSADVRADFQAARERAKRWYPSAMPKNWDDPSNPLAQKKGDRHG